ncbi:MAG: MFS transporter [Akkermansiaceae bacterium]|nr:MFS transporter [Akkermansiaceae bacterium]MDP4898843.1 MFS transporter [Akkermansiaceae bacterium]
MVLLALAKTPVVFVAVSFLCGLMTCLYYPASSSLIADLIGKELRVRAYAVQRFSINLAFACGMMTAGLVASSSFFWLFIADAGTTAILGLIVLFGLKRGIGRAPSKNAGWGDAVPFIARDWAFLRVVGASFLVAVIFWQTSSTFGLQVTEGSGLNEKAFGFLLGLNGLMIVLMELPLTNVTKRFDPQKTMAFGYVLIGGGLCLLAFGASLPMLILSIVVLTLGEMIAMPIASSYVANLAPDDMRGRYMGVLGFSWNTAVGVGPMVGLWIFGRSPELLWLLCGLAGVLAASLILVRARISSPKAVDIPAS